MQCPEPRPRRLHIRLDSRTIIALFVLVVSSSGFEPEACIRLVDIDWVAVRTEEYRDLLTNDLSRTYTFLYGCHTWVTALCAMHYHENCERE
jgi:hypothetical protein